MSGGMAVQRACPGIDGSSKDAVRSLFSARDTLYVCTGAGTTHVGAEGYQ